MPLYDFKCKQCDTRFELLCSISEKDAVVCPKCGGTVERVYQGKCSFGACAGKGGSGCSGHCEGCKGCH